MSSKEKPNVEIIDKDGDTLLRVGTKLNYVYFRVTMAVLRLITPSWGKLRIWSATTELNLSDLLEPATHRVELPGDKQGPVRILLALGHLKFNTVPIKLQLDSIADLAKLCLKYKVYHLVYTCVREWMKPVLEKEVTRETCASRLWVAWVFGNEDELRRAARFIMCMDEHEIQGLGDLPPRFMDFLTQITKKRMKRTTDRVYSLLDDTIKSNDKCDRHSASAGQKKQCEFQRMAATVAFLQSCQLSLTSEAKHPPSALKSNPNTIAAAARRMEQQAKMTISGTVHEGCVSKITACAQELREKFQTSGEIETALAALILERPMA